MSPVFVIQAQRVSKTEATDFSEVQRVSLPVELRRHGASDLTSPITLQSLVLLIRELAYFLSRCVDR